VTHADGTVTRGESVLREVGKAVSRVGVEPAGAWRGPGLPTGVVLCAATSGAMMRRGPSLERGSGLSIC
jgi:hypothetical protein